MSQKRNLKLTKKTFWLTLLLLAVAGGGGYAYYTLNLQPAAANAEQSTVQTATVRRGDLVLYANGTGSLIPANEVSFGFKSSGDLIELNVSVGDRVEAGQLLARLDDSAEQSRLVQTRRTLLELTSPLAIAQAAQKVADNEQARENAFNKLAHLVSPSVLNWEERLASAQLTLAEAQAAAESDSSTEAQQKVTNAEKTVKTAEANLAYANSQYQDYLLDNFAETEVDRRTGVETVVYYTDATTGESYPLIYAPTAAQIASARSAYELAKATLTESEVYLAALRGEEIPETATGSSLTKLEEARENLASAQLAIEYMNLYAPISGTIMSLDLTLGERVGTSPVITIADLSQAYLEIYLDDTDWDKIDVGYPVEVTFDALPDRVFNGTVTQVDPALFTQAGSSLVRGLVRLDQIPDSFRLPIGASASADVIGGRAEGAVLVPVEALREIAPGEYTVFVMENGNPRLRTVEIGIKDLLYAEVKSGLEPGEVVTTGIVETE